MDIINVGHGLMFALQEEDDKKKYENSIRHLPKEEDDKKKYENSIRHLLNLGIFRVEVFPPSAKNPDNTYGYCLTDVGRIILVSEFKNDLFPRILADLFLLEAWSEHLSGFPERERLFELEYKIPWKECFNLFVRQLKKITEIYDCDDKKTPCIRTSFNMYRRGKAFNIIMNDVVTPWLEEVNKNKKN